MAAAGFVLQVVASALALGQFFFYVGRWVWRRIQHRKPTKRFLTARRVAAWVIFAGWIALIFVSDVRGKIVLAGSLLVLFVAAQVIEFRTDYRKTEPPTKTVRKTFDHDDGLASEYLLMDEGSVRAKVYNLSPHVHDEYRCVFVDPERIKTDGQASITSGIISKTAVIFYPAGFNGAPSVINGSYEVTWVRYTLMSTGGAFPSDLFTDGFEIKGGEFVD
jgi:hypothetical protein